MPQIDYEIIVFSEEWNGLPFSCKHLLRNFLPDIPLIWVETIGLRAPTFSAYDLSRVTNKVINWFCHPSRENGSEVDNLVVMDPIQIPYNQVALVRNFNKWILGKKLKSLLDARSCRDKVVITTWPFTGNLVGYFGERLNIYYRVDDFSEFPGVDKKRIACLEKELIEKVDIVIASAQNLMKGIHIDGKPVKYIPHGVDYEHFSPKRNDSSKRLPIQEIPTPRIGFFGLINSWVDLDLLGFVAAHHPQWSFIFIGPSQLPMSSLPKGNNIYYLGKIPYEMLPLHAQYFDVGLIPFKVNALTEAVNPLKMMEYFSMGLPVVSTPIPEVLKYKDLVKIASDPKSFGVAIEAAFKQDSERSRRCRKNLAKRHSWKEKSVYLKRLIEEALEQKNCS